MTDAMISAEDRERLAKSKFGEWFDEFFDKKFEEAFEKKASAAPKREKKETESSSESDAKEERHTPTPRRRSLLETCLSDTFGF